MPTVSTPRPAVAAASGPARPGPGHLAWGALGFALVVLTPVFGYVAGALQGAALLVPAYAAVVVGAATAVPVGRGWRDPGVVLLVLFWAVFAAWAPVAYGRAPDATTAREELLALALGAGLSLSLVAVSRGRPDGLAALRWGWVAALALTGTLGAIEFVTGRHLGVWVTRPWPFGDGVVASTFRNPNDFGAALVAMLGAVLATRARADSRALRAALTALAAGSFVLVMLTQSRGCVAGAALLLVLEGVRLARAAADGHRLRDLAREHYRVVTALLTAFLVVALASFAVPPLAARNPLAQILAAAQRPETAEADTLRVGLIAAALRYLRDSGYAGTGAGSYEVIMWNDPASGVAKQTNLHNAFVELLSQYGVLVSVPLLLLLVVCVGRLLRPAPDSVDRNEAAAHLLAFALLGVTASSALTMPMWWLMLASGVAVAWSMRRGDPRVPRLGSSAHPPMGRRTAQH